MLDGEKFLRELPVLHGKIEMPDYNGVCTGVYLICEKGMGFIGNINDWKNRRYFREFIPSFIDIINV